MEQQIAILLSTIGALVFVVNIVTEVLKKFTAEIIPTNFVVVLLSIVLTMLTFIAWCDTYGIVVLWYYILAALVVGFFVAYAAMFGFDKLKESIKKLMEKQ